MTLFFIAIMSRNDVTLCELDVNVKKRTADAVASLNLSRNSLKEQRYFIASSTLKIKFGKSKGMQEKVSIMSVWCG